MAKSITIRNVPDQTHHELAAQAARSGRSLQQYLRTQLIELGARPNPEDLLAQIRERTQRSGVRLGARKILAYRNAGRR